MKRLYLIVLWFMFSYLLLSRWRTLAVCVFLSISSTFSVFGKDDVVPVESFFNQPEMSNPKLSPDGKFLAYLAATPDDRKTALYTLNLETDESYGFRGQTDQDIYRYYWLNNDWLVFNVSKENVYSLGLYAVKKDDPKSLAVCEMYSASRVVDLLPKEENCFWVHLIASNNKRDSQLVKYDISKRSSNKGGVQTTFSSLGREVETVRDPEDGYVLQWITDLEGVPRIAMSFRDEEDKYYLISDEEDWIPMELDPEEFDIIGFKNDHEIYVTGYGDQNTEGLYSYDLRENQFSERILQDDRYDIDPTVKRSRKTGETIGYWYTTKFEINEWIDPHFKAVQALIDKTFAGRTNTIVSYTENADKFIVISSTASEPPIYYLLDTKEGKVIQLSKWKPALQSIPRNGVFSFEFTTSDNLKLTAYLTKPAGKEKEEVPLVVLIHGGPWVRDYWDWNTEVQFLANRGYGVLQVNYRGSSGYGVEISSDNAFEYDLMIQDLKEAIDLVVNSGYADEDNIAVMGASFGGYATISLAAKYPDRFKCAIAMAGVYDMAEQIKSLEEKEWRYGRGDAGRAYTYFKENLGDPKLDSEYLKSISPLYIADQIKCPVLVAHGKDDFTVSYKQSKLLLKELKKADVEYETFFKYREGHGFAEEENRVEFYKKVEKFLFKHMPVK